MYIHPRVFRHLRSGGAVVVSGEVRLRAQVDAPAIEDRTVYQLAAPAERLRRHGVSFTPYGGQIDDPGQRGGALSYHVGKAFEQAHPGCRIAADRAFSCMEALAISVFRSVDTTENTTVASVMTSEGTTSAGV